jgi:hypothetical protein
MLKFVCYLVKTSNGTRGKCKANSGQTPDNTKPKTMFAGTMCGL